MNTYRPVEIGNARAVADAHGLEQIVIWSFNALHGQHVTTWGGPKLSDSLRAAEAGNAIKKAAGWPPELTKALPCSLAEILTALDATLARDIRVAKIDKRTVLAVFFALREEIRARDPELAEQIVPRACEEAEMHQTGEL